jgi:hypothetical protein
MFKHWDENGGSFHKYCESGMLDTENRYKRLSWLEKVEKTVWFNPLFE